jgi:LPS sulfotransferase NodH
MRNVAASAAGRLLARSAIARLLAEEPEIHARPIRQPIFVIGGWRTGTTLLQRLLAALPGLRGVYPAELIAPWRFAGLDRKGRDAALNAEEAAHSRLHLLNPALQAVHPSGPRLAEECVLAMGTDFRSWGFTSSARCPGYAAWLLTQDFTNSYRRYADILRILDDNSGDRWILKAPAHTAELDSLLKLFPDAHVLHLHRDVVQTVTSSANLFAVLRSTYSDSVDLADVGRYQLDMTAKWFDRALRARDAHLHAHIVDISFKELIADPIAMVKSVCRACGVEWSAETQERVETPLSDLTGRHDEQRVMPQDFGLEPGEIRDRFAMYLRRFDNL